jgi:hypothetical protein
MTYTPTERLLIMVPTIFVAVLLVSYFVLDILGVVAGSTAVGPR